MKMPKNRTGALLFLPTHRIRLGNQKQQWGENGKEVCGCGG